MADSSSTERECCKNCKFFWRRYSEGAGDCRRFPPQLYYDGRVGASLRARLVDFPEIENPHTVWCGEWQALPVGGE